jgi:hypothetical protein
LKQVGRVVRSLADVASQGARNVQPLFADHPLTLDGQALYLAAGQALELEAGD